ncbi:MAG: PAS domain S-box protein, partial [Desulfobacteraceae bacterium]|nr:PAS domain S-box protein [Desulfobacteraceae bacterium]
FWNYYRNNSEFTTLQESSIKTGAYESQDFFPRFGNDGMWLFVTACPLIDDHGEIIGAIETFQNVTKLINTQKELTKNEKKYRSLFADAGDALFLMDYDRVIDCNTLSLELFCCSHHDIIGNSFFKFSVDIQPDGLNAIDRFQEKTALAYGGKTQRFFWQHKNFKGESFDASITLSRVEINGQYVLQVIIRDISNHVKAQNELTTLRNYLSNIIDAMPSVLIGVDENHRVTLWNFLAQKQTGLSTAQALGKHIVQVFPRLEDELAQIDDAMKEEKIIEDTKIPYESDKEVVYENITIYPLASDQMKGAVIRVDDVTERVQMEEMMIQSEKMMSVGGLAAGMAHEINNPLAGMMQNAQVLLNRASTYMPVNERVAIESGTTLEVINAYMEKRGILKLAEMIHNSGSHAAKIVRNMLSFAKKNSSDKLAHYLPVLLDQTVEIACSDYNLKQDYDFKQIKIIRHYGKDIPQVVCNDSKIQQVFWNILRNGAEAMQKKEGISQFVLRMYKEDDQICIEIEDNGPGMDKTITKRVFEPFFTTKGKEKGTGLGLAVSYFIITKDHGG